MGLGDLARGLGDLLGSVDFGAGACSSSEPTPTAWPLLVAWTMIRPAVFCCDVSIILINILFLSSSLFSSFLSSTLASISCRNDTGDGDVAHCGFVGWGTKIDAREDPTPCPTALALLGEKGGGVDAPSPCGDSLV